MLYQAYQAQCDALAPARMFADNARNLLDLTCPWLAGLPMVRGAAAALDMFLNGGVRHERPDFGIDRVVVDGAEVAVTEEAIPAHPFCRLLHFRRSEERRVGKECR